MNAGRTEFDARPEPVERLIEELTKLPGLASVLSSLVASCQQPPALGRGLGRAGG